MTSKKEINSKLFSLSSQDKKKIINEKIIFIDFVPKNNLLLLLSSNNIFYICEIINDSITIKKTFRNVIDSKIKINKSYFCNENPNIILIKYSISNKIE